MDALQSLATEFSITVADASVWLSIGQALLFGAVCLVFGTGVATTRGPSRTGRASWRDPRRRASDPVSSCSQRGGRQSPPEAGACSRRWRLASLVAVALALARRVRRPVGNVAPPEPSGSMTATPDRVSEHAQGLDPRHLGGARVHRRRRPPLRFDDVGQSSGLGPAGRVHRRGVLRDPRARPRQDGNRDDLPRHLGSPTFRACRLRPGITGARCGWPRRSSSVFGSEPLAARNLVVLPVLLLAAAALTGTVVQRLANIVVRTCLCVRVRRVPRSGAGPADFGRVFHELGSGSDLWDHAIRPRGRGRLAGALQPDGPWVSEGDMGPRGVRGQLLRSDRPSSSGRGHPGVRRRRKCLGDSISTLDADHAPPPEHGCHVWRRTLVVTTLGDHRDRRLGLHDGPCGDRQHGVADGDPVQLSLA